MSQQSHANVEITEQKTSDVPVVAPRSGRDYFSLWVAVLAIILAIFLRASLFEGEGLVPSDGIFNFAPWLQSTNKPSDSLLADQYLVFIPQHEFTHRQFLQGEFPLWNPNMDCGEPNLASIQGALFFPVNLLLLPIDPFYAAGIAAYLKLFLAGLFTMLYMRLLGASNAGAFFAGLVFSLSGFMVCWLGHPHVNCAMCMPLLLYALEKSFQYGCGDAPGLMSAPALRIWAWLAVAFGCLLLGGHPPTMVQVAIFIGIYFLFRLIGQRSRRLERVGLAGCAAVLGFFLAAPALLPFFEYYRHSSMDAASAILNRAGDRLPLSALILYLFPHLNGGPSEGFEDTMLWLGTGNLMPNFFERTGYVGVLPLLFALCGIILRRCPWTMFYGAVTLICMLSVYGIPPFPAMFQNLPVLRDISPVRLVMIAGFSMAVMAGLGWDSFWRLENARKKMLLVAGFWTVMGLILFCYWLHVESRWKYLDTDHRAFLKPQFLMFIGSLAASAALLLSSVGRHRLLYSIIGLGWVGVDLLVFGTGINPAIPRDSYYPSAPSIAWLQQDTTNFRLIGMGTTLVPNTPELFGFKDARGYDFVTERNYEKLIEGDAVDFFFYRTMKELPKAFPLLGVKYILAFNSPPLDPASFDLVYSNEVTIYRNRQFYGRAVPVFNYKVEQDADILAQVRSGAFNPEQTVLLDEEPVNSDQGTQLSVPSADSSAHIVSEQSDEVTVEASMSRSGFLLLLDTYFPGWKATVNGLNMPILRADYNFRAVQLPAGNSTVRFVYEPESFRWGVALFLTGSAIVMAAFLASLRKRRINNPP